MVENKFQNGEKGNHSLLVRLSESQYNRIKTLAESSGFKTTSQFVRSQLLNPSVDYKLNEILVLLKEKEKENKK